MLTQCAKMRIEALRERFAPDRRRTACEAPTKLETPPAEIERGYQRFADTVHW